MITLQTTLASPSRMGLDLMAVDEGAPLELDLRLESVHESGGYLFLRYAVAPGG